MRFGTLYQICLMLDQVGTAKVVFVTNKGEEIVDYDSSKLIHLLHREELQEMVSWRYISCL